MSKNKAAALSDDDDEKKKAAAGSWYGMFTNVFKQVDELRKTIGTQTYEVATATYNHLHSIYEQCLVQPGFLKFGQEVKASEVTKKIEAVIKKPAQKNSKQMEADVGGGKKIRWLENPDGSVDMILPAGYTGVVTVPRRDASGNYLSGHENLDIYDVKNGKPEPMVPGKKGNSRAVTFYVDNGAGVTRAAEQHQQTDVVMTTAPSTPTIATSEDFNQQIEVGLQLKDGHPIDFEERLNKFVQIMNDVLEISPGILDDLKTMGLEISNNQIDRSSAEREIKQYFMGTDGYADDMVEVFLDNIAPKLNSMLKPDEIYDEWMENQLDALERLKLEEVEVEFEPTVYKPQRLLRHEKLELSQEHESEVVKSPPRHEFGPIKPRMKNALLREATELVKDSRNYTPAVTRDTATIDPAILPDHVKKAVKSVKDLGAELNEAKHNTVTPLPDLTREI